MERNENINKLKKVFSNNLDVIVEDDSVISYAELTDWKIKEATIALMAHFIRQVSNTDIVCVVDENNDNIALLLVTQDFLKNFEIREEIIKGGISYV